MNRNRRPALPLLTWGLIMALASCSGDGSSSSGEDRSRSPGAIDPSRSSGTSSAVADQLSAQAVCVGEFPNNHAADFTWRPADPPGDAQQLVLSYLEGGLDTDAYVQTQVLPAAQADHRWIHLNPGTELRYWRVLTRRGDLWLPSETATFRGTDCPS